MWHLSRCLLKQQAFFRRGKIYPATNTLFLQAVIVAVWGISKEWKLESIFPSIRSIIVAASKENGHDDLTRLQVPVSARIAIPIKRRHRGHVFATRGQQREFGAELLTLFKQWCKAIRVPAESG